MLLVAQNKIKELPLEIGQLPKLKILMLDGNQLTALPCSR